MHVCSAFNLKLKLLNGAIHWTLDSMLGCMVHCRCHAVPLTHAVRGRDSETVNRISD